MTLEQQMYDADRAREVLENEQFTQAFTDIKQEIFRAWETSPPRDEEGRQELFRLTKALQKVQAMLTARLETGKMAKLQQEQEQALLARDRQIDTSGWSSPYS